LIWYGKHSAEYVSLGTWVWPRKLIELVLNIIRSLLDVEPPTSFVFTKPAEDSDIPDDLLREVRISGRGIIVLWAPQVRVLQHDATGMMLVSSVSTCRASATTPLLKRSRQTHCGIGFAKESTHLWGANNHPSVRRGSA